MSVPLFPRTQHLVVAELRALDACMRRRPSSGDTAHLRRPANFASADGADGRWRGACRPLRRPRTSRRRMERMGGRRGWRVAAVRWGRQKLMSSRSHGGGRRSEARAELKDEAGVEAGGATGAGAGGSAGARPAGARAGGRREEAQAMRGGGAGCRGQEEVRGRRWGRVAEWIR